jgi:exodeoxyribonuclease-5
MDYKNKFISDSIRNSFKFTPTEDQNELIEKLGNFLSEIEQDDIFVIKGYAGTGKTSVISSLIKILPTINKQSVLLAPTGRAAKVLSEYSEKRAYTIHKKIYRIKTTKDGFTYLTLETNKHKNTIFIVDEASMIPDSSSGNESSMFSGRNLLDDLFYYINDGINCNLILIGDTAQLPPVGLPISPALDLHYLKTSYKVNIFSHELTQVVRQAEESGILKNATALRVKINSENYKPPFFNIHGYEDICSISGNQLEELLLNCYSNYDKTDNVIICKSNKRANLFNQEIRKRILFQENEIAAGDFLMVLKNNYYWLPSESQAGFIANGDIIEILKINKIEEIYGFRFADLKVRLIDFPDEKDLNVKVILDSISIESAALSQEEGKKLWDEISKDYEDIPTKKERLRKIKNNPYLNALQVKYAYALTCHKTQGGQWKNVFIDQGWLNKDMIDKEYLRWLYTALTRAMKNVYLINFDESFFAENNQ